MLLLVGQDEDRSVVRLNQKLLANYGLISPGASRPLVKRRTMQIRQCLKPQLSAKDSFLPHDVEMTLTRNYGETAAEKSDELLHMLLDVVSSAYSSPSRWAGGNR